MVVTKLTAIKLQNTDSDDASYVHCELDDPNTCEFRLQYVGARYTECTIDFTNKFLAEQVSRAMNQVFKQGKLAAKKELKDWIGV